MLICKAITTHSDNLAEIKELYRHSFPRKERGPFHYMLDDSDGKTEILAFYDGDTFCGFATLLNNNGITHIIYLAIEDDLRDRGYGSQVLNAVHKLKGDSRIIVDIEKQTDTANNNEQRRKRKEFYLRNGYEETPVCYNWHNELYEILSFGGNITEQEFEDFWEGFKHF